jgi:hypothetical protein
MDIITLIFVGGLCIVAFLLTLTIRRELIAKERRSPEDRHQPPRPRPKR